MLVQIACDCYYVRDEALKKIENPDLLLKVHINRIKSIEERVADPLELLTLINEDKDLAEIVRHGRSHDMVMGALSKIADERILVDLASTLDEYRGVETVARLTGEDSLAEVIRRSKKTKVVTRAIERLSDEQLMRRLIQDQDILIWNRIEIAERITDQSSLKDFYESIATKDNENALIRVRAARNLQDEALAQSIFLDMVYHYEDWSDRSNALYEIKDEEILAGIAKSSSANFKYKKNIEWDNIDHAISTECDFRLDAVRRIRRHDLLSDIAVNAGDKEVRESARKELNWLKSLQS